LSSPLPRRPPSFPLANQYLQFDFDYLAQGYRGGRRAALALRNELNSVIVFKISTFANASFPSPEIQLLIKVFIDEQALTNRVEGKDVDLKAFAAGFNSSGFATSMVDVGGAVGATDEAIKGTASLFCPSLDRLLTSSRFLNRPSSLPSLLTRLPLHRLDARRTLRL
jgi:hypothetical protein